MKNFIVKCVKCGWCGVIPWSDNPGAMYEACPVCSHNIFISVGINDVAKQMKTPMQNIREYQGVFEMGLENKMADVSVLVADFVKETGVPVSGIRIEFIEITTIAAVTEYYISGVRVDYGM